MVAVVLLRKTKEAQQLSSELSLTKTTFLLEGRSMTKTSFLLGCQVFVSVFVKIL